MDFNTLVAIAGACAAAIATYVNLKLKGDTKDVETKIETSISNRLQNLETRLTSRIDAANSLNTNIENRIMTKIEEMRKEMFNGFVPANVAQEQRTNVERRVVENEREIGRNRENLHTLANRFTEMIMGPVQKINDQLTENARRMSGFEERQRVVEIDLRGHEKRIEDLEEKS